jgi:hypothetical protein
VQFVAAQSSHDRAARQSSIVKSTLRPAVNCSTIGREIGLNVRGGLSIQSCRSPLDFKHLRGENAEPSGES